MRLLRLKTFFIAAAIAAMGIQPTLGGYLLRTFYDNFGLGLAADADGIDAVVAADDWNRDFGAFPEELRMGFTNIQDGINSDDGIDNFGSLTRGYIIAPMTGTYTVVVGSDDDSELYLNTGANSHTVISLRNPQFLIGEETDWTNGDIFTAARLDQRSSEVQLTKGQVYYVELIHREGGGGSFINVGWVRPDGVSETIPDTALIPFGAPNAQDFTPATTTQISEQPESLTVTEADTATFKITAHGAQPLRFQWLKNGQPIDGAILQHYTIQEAALADNGANYSVRVTGPNNQSVTSSAASLTVNADTTPPQVTSISTSGQPRGVIVRFSEKVTQATATAAANYAFTGQSVTVQGISMLSDTSVLIDIGEFTDEALSLRISGIKDRSSRGNTIASTTSNIAFASPGATYFFYDNPPGLGFYPTADRGKGRYPTNYAPFDGSVMGLASNFSARRSSTTPYLEVPNSGNPAVNPPGDVQNNYGLVIFGYIVPKETSDYYFYIAVDDNSEFWLSTDESPANTTLIAREPLWNGVREWNGTANDENKSGAIPLQAGRRYYFEMLTQEGGGGDNAAVTWNTSGTAPANGQGTPITSEFLQQATKTGSLRVTQEPASVSTVEGVTATFTMAAAGSDPWAIGYAWYKNDTLVPGANLPTYTINPTALSDNGAVIRGEAYNLNGTFNRAVTKNVTLNVTDDSVPPTLSSVNATPLKNQVLISFDEPVDPVTAGNVANYSIVNVNGGAALAVQSVTLNASNTGANIVTAVQGDSVKYQLTVRNLTDRFGNSGQATKTFLSFALGQGGLTALFYEDSGTTLNFYPQPRGQNNVPAGWNPFGAQAPGSGNQALVAARQSSVAPYFESPASGTITTSPGNAADNYAQVLFGWLQPEVTGTYRFFLAADDSAELYLSTDESPANSRRIAVENNWTGIRTWSNREATDNNLNDGDTGTTSDPIQLQAGRRYYIEAINSEGGGGDNLAVAWSFTTNGTDPARPANGAPPIPGNVLWSYLPVSDDILASDITPADGATAVWLNQGTVSGKLTDGFSNKVDTASFTATLNGNAVDVNAGKVGDVTTFTVSLPAMLGEGADYSVVVSYKNTDGEAFSHTIDFTTESLPVLPGELAAPLGSGSNPGFTARTVQAPAGTGLTNDTARGEAQLAGSIAASNFFGGPVVLPVINLNQDLNGNAGAIGGDQQFEALGLMAAGNTDEASAEFLTYAEFSEAGIYRMGVNSDDGFRITAGTTHAVADQTVELGVFSGGRGANASTPQSPAYFRVCQPGVYALRMIWYEGTGGANVEWTIRNPQGQWVLLNSADSHVKTFTAAGAPAGVPCDEPPPGGVQMAVSRDGNSVTLTWDPATGTLQGAAAVNGPYTDVAGASSPHTVTADQAARFYRVKQ